MIPGALTVREILADIPHDGPAILLYLLLALCVGFVWLAGRGREGTSGASPETHRNLSRKRSR